MNRIISEAIKEKIQLIQTYTDDERILAQCNLILKILDDKTEFKEIPFFEGDNNESN